MDRWELIRAHTHSTRPRSSRGPFLSQSPEHVLCRPNLACQHHSGNSVWCNPVKKINVQPAIIICLPDDPIGAGVPATGLGITSLGLNKSLWRLLVDPMDGLEYGRATWKGEIGKGPCSQVQVGEPHLESTSSFPILGIGELRKFSEDTPKCGSKDSVLLAQV